MKYSNQDLQDMRDLKSGTWKEEAKALRKFRDLQSAIAKAVADKIREHILSAELVALTKDERQVVTAYRDFISNPRNKPGAMFRWQCPPREDITCCPWHKHLGRVDTLSCGPIPGPVSVDLEIAVPEQANEDSAA